MSAIDDIIRRMQGIETVTIDDVWGTNGKRSAIVAAWGSGAVWEFSYDDSAERIDQLANARETARGNTYVIDNTI